MYAPDQPTTPTNQKVMPNRTHATFRTGLITLLALMLFGLLCPAITSAEPVPTPTPEPTPTPSAEQLKLEEERKLLLLKKDIEEAHKAIRDAQPQPPQPTATPLAGDVTLEGVRLETELVSYNSMSGAAVAIAKEINSKAKNAQTIAIYDAQIVKDWRFYQALNPAFKGQVRELQDAYRAALKLGPLAADREVGEGLVSPVSSALAVGTTLLKSFVDLTAFFRTDTKIQGVAVTINESALAAELLRELKAAKNGLNLYYPAVITPRLVCKAGDAGCEKKERSKTLVIVGDLFEYKRLADVEITKKSDENKKLAEAIKPQLEELAKLKSELGKVEELMDRRTRLQDAKNAETDPVVRRKLNAIIVRLTTEIHELKSVPELKALIAAIEAKIKGPRDQIAANEKEIKKFTDLNSRLQKFIDEFVKVDSNGVNALALLVKSEDIDLALEGDESYWVEIKSVTAGGNNRTRKNLIRYFTGPKIDHSGGIVVEYVLYNKSGAVVYSDKLSCYGGYVPPKKIAALEVDRANPQCLKF